MNTIEEKIQKDLQTAMKSRDILKENTLKVVKTLIMESKTAPGANHNPSDDDILKILQKIAKKRKDTRDLYEQNNRHDLAEKEYAEYEIIKSYLPQMLTEGEVDKIVTDTITDLGAMSMKDMGKVMGHINKAYAGKIDPSMVAKKVKAYLS